MRATLSPVIARNPYLKASAKADGDHGPIPCEDFRAVADVVRETAAARVLAAHDLEVC
ncbi:hypothetical protein ACIRQP_18625 [Streptomyces sp. NPDC102274]|uniref:hypothetical protein n=1 Tax=Streptomyces sp. NPDC102274 TaxID=3366151 RepID=UPI0037FAED78